MSAIIARSDPARRRRVERRVVDVSSALHTGAIWTSTGRPATSSSSPVRSPAA